MLYDVPYDIPEFGKGIGPPPRGVGYHGIGVTTLLPLFAFLSPGSGVVLVSSWGSLPALVLHHLGEVMSLDIDGTFCHEASCSKLTDLMSRGARDTDFSGILGRKLGHRWPLPPSPCWKSTLLFASHLITKEMEFSGYQLGRQTTAKRSRTFGEFTIDTNQTTKLLLVIWIAIRKCFFMGASNKSRDQET